MDTGHHHIEERLAARGGDLTVTVEAGVPFERLQAELGKRGQWLSLDPAASDRATVGGILASDASGPRRHLYGTARDLCFIRSIEVFRSKNISLNCAK